MCILWSQLWSSGASGLPIATFSVGYCHQLGGHVLVGCKYKRKDLISEAVILPCVPGAVLCCYHGHHFRQIPVLLWNNQLIVVNDQDSFESVHVPEDAVIHGGAFVHFHIVVSGACSLCPEGHRLPEVHVSFFCIMEEDSNYFIGHAVVVGSDLGHVKYLLQFHPFHQLVGIVAAIGSTHTDSKVSLLFWLFWDLNS